jgi:hypothetical protein
MQRSSGFSFSVRPAITAGISAEVTLTGDCYCICRSWRMRARAARSYVKFGSGVFNAYSEGSEDLA